MALSDWPMSHRKKRRTSDLGLIIDVLLKLAMSEVQPEKSSVATDTQVPHLHQAMPFTMCRTSRWGKHQTKYLNIYHDTDKHFFKWVSTTHTQLFRTDKLFISTYLSARVVIQKLPLHALIGKNVVMETNTSCWNVLECVTTMKNMREFPLLA